MKHDDLVQYYATGQYDTDASLECYFHSYSGNLHAVYIGEHEVFNILSNNTIAELEEEYSRFCRMEREEAKLDAARDRYQENI
jgi:hypothetical protein